MKRTRRLSRNRLTATGYGRLADAEQPPDLGPDQLNVHRPGRVDGDDWPRPIGLADLANVSAVALRSSLSTCTGCRDGARSAYRRMHSSIGPRAARKR
jgi:hypothetical protein